MLRLTEETIRGEKYWGFGLKLHSREANEDSVAGSNEPVITADFKLSLHDVNYPSNGSKIYSMGKLSFYNSTLSLILFAFTIYCNFLTNTEYTTGTFIDEVGSDGWISVGWPNYKRVGKSLAEEVVR